MIYNKNLVDDVEAITTREIKVVYAHRCGKDSNKKIYDMAECPTCGYVYKDSFYDWETKICTQCGARLKW